MSRLLFLTTIALLFCTLSFKLRAEVQQVSQVMDNSLANADLLDFALSGVSSIDYAKVRADLLAMQPNIKSFQKRQQAFYWYNLALASRALALSSEQTIPPIKNALTLVFFVEPQLHFKILTTSINLFFAYQQYDLVLQSIEQLKKLTESETKRLPVTYENQKAWAYYQLGRLDEAELSFSQLIEEANVNGAEADINWYRVLSSIHQKHGNVAKQIGVLLKEYELRPSDRLQKRIAFLQNHYTNPHK